jgi:4-amino-4-deoxy-L-arabinose transferase-like glycosyltransferase
VQTPPAPPALQRGVSAAIDWFSVFFFSASAIAIWVIYIAMQTGAPARIAANVSKLAPGFAPRFQGMALLLGVLGSVAWLGLVRWRTGRHRHVLWKSLVLPAGGVALSWLLLMTLWLPLLDYARSYRPLVQRLAQQLPARGCLVTDGLSRSQLAALRVHGPWTLPATGADTDRCNWLLVANNDRRSANEPAPVRAGWRFVSRVQRPTDKQEFVLIYRRG